MQQTQSEKIEELAVRILNLSRDSIIMNMRFMDVALSKLELVSKPGYKGMSVDGTHLYYDAAFVLRKYKNEPAYLQRCFLHSMLHLVFFHPFKYQAMDIKYWDIATDIAVENVIMEMKIGSMGIRKDAELRAHATNLKIKCGALTAEKIYKYFKKNQIDDEELQDYRILFKRDEHLSWAEAEVLEMTMEQWKKISERIKTDLKTFSKDKGNSDSLEKNLNEATRDKIDYSDILRRFTVMGEELKPNEEEFDYIYYTYGLEHYGNMPLVEPLEYKDTKKVKEFVIAIDTSGSCRGKVVQSFLNKTYSILKGTENFFTQVNIHIVQCDNEVQSDTEITSDSDFEQFLKTGKLTGFGATDFRPVFDYVDRLITEDSFENLKGLIYFTDGYGVYPERMPGYDVIFAFLNEDEHRPPVPSWAIQVVLEDDELQSQEDEDEENRKSKIVKGNGI